MTLLLPMQPDLCDDAALLRETTVRFVEAELPLARIRELHEDPTGYDPAWLQKSAALGWFALLVPEELGGGSVSGTGLVDAAVVAEVIGRYVQPGPFVPMNVVASALSSHGSQRARAEVLPRIVAGDVVATWAFADDRGIADDGAGVAARYADDAFRLTGTRGFVQEAPSADQLLVTATLGGGPIQLLVPTQADGITVRPLASLDLARRFAHVEFDDVFVPEWALVQGGPEAIASQLHVALVLLLAETVGAMDALFEMTVAYAKDRVAFGRPIGSFQAIKHILADQLLYLETCKAGVVAAVNAVARSDGDAGEVVSMVAAYVGDQSNELAQECLQVHGGIGYTWEHDLHLLLRRVRSNAALFGEPSSHRERVCALQRLGERETRGR